MSSGFFKPNTPSANCNNCSALLGTHKGVNLLHCALFCAKMRNIKIYKDVLLNPFIQEKTTQHNTTHCYCMQIDVDVFFKQAVLLTASNHVVLIEHA